MSGSEALLPGPHPSCFFLLRSQSMALSAHEGLPGSLRRGCRASPWALPERSSAGADGSYEAGEALARSAISSVGWRARTWSGEEDNLEAGDGATGRCHS